MSIDDTKWTGVQIVQRDDTVTVTRGVDVLAEKTGVAWVQQPATREWSVSFEDGSVWQVVAPKKKGCGCQ